MRIGLTSPWDPRAGSPRQAAFAWLLVASWIGLVLWLGSGGFGAATTQRLFLPVLHWLLPDLGSAQLASLALAIRKLAHPAVYAVLALLALRAWRLTLGGGALRAGLLACALAVGVAALDESRQAYETGRTGSARDVALDGAGAAAAVGLAIALRPRRETGRR